MSATSTLLRVLISDDDPMIRDALREVLDAEPDIDVVGVAADADEAIALAARHAPAVVVLDVRMPGGGGPRAAREILGRAPGTRILAFSAYDDSGTVAEMTRAGIAEYLLKGASNIEIVAAVRRAGTQ
ncbi:MAG TPA: response regulator transcription factor [Actinophytocola sp.]|jgi:DNA-binding NarL/FixJ family response regulator|uniref:response regulator n=1 Tax=Actinophytocola sp. TaxID=1872138 RepID=UPI002F935365